jgi:hypothetical protein
MPEAGIEKTPRAARPLNIDAEEIKQRRLVWRFADHDDDGTYSLGAISPEQLMDLIKKLRSFESMTVGELFAAGSQHGKTYEVEEMPKPAKDRLVDLGRDDETQVARLRCGGAPRLYGFLREHVFHVLWWDPNHQVWPSKKKRT